MHGLLSIGDFSRITHLSVKTLRRYHESGLLEPAEVDARTGYRFYTTAQVPTAQVIRRFRDLGMPVREVHGVVSTADPDQRSALIGEHLARLEQQLDQTRAAVMSLRRLLDPAPTALAVVRRTTEPVRVAAVRGTVDLADVLDWYSSATAEIDALLATRGLTPTGPPGGLYDNELFTEERGDMLVFVPVADPPTSGRVVAHLIPATELALTVHVGSHDDIDVTYGELGAYVEQHALAIGGPVRETYLVGPRDTPEEGRWRTEIGWPVFTTSAAPA